MKTIFDEIISWIPLVLLSLWLLIGFFAGLIGVYCWILSLLS